MLTISDDYYAVMHQVTFVQLNKGGDLFGLWVPHYIPADCTCAPIHMDLVEILNDKCNSESAMFKVSSGYRTCARNALAGGVGQSGHLIGFAADLTGPRASLKTLYDQLYEKRVPGLILTDDYLHIDFLPRIYRRDKRTNQTA